jgi:hypothetical protein
VPVNWSYRSGILIVETIGAYGRGELQRALADARADPGFAAGTPVLFDGRLSEVDISTADIDWRVQFASGLRAMEFSTRCAIVVRDRMVTFGLGRMLSLRLEGEDMDLNVTRNFDEALLWLMGRAAG